MNTIIKRVLIDGGTGFVAFWMHQTVPPGIHAAFLSQQDYWDSVWTDIKWDAIVHLAPISPRFVLQQNARVLFASSGAVYEKQDKYADNKRAWEEECVHSNTDTVIARLFCFMGEHLMEKMWDGSTPSILQFIWQGIAGGPIHYYDVGFIRSYMYGADLGRWLWKLLLEGNGVYDVGSSIPLSMRTVAKTVARVCGCEAVRDLSPEDKPMIYLPNVKRAHELGCVETVGLTEMIERTVEFERQKKI